MRTRTNRLLVAVITGTLALPTASAVPVAAAVLPAAGGLPAAAEALAENPFVVNVESLPSGTGAAGAMDLTVPGSLDWVQVTSSRTERKATATPYLTIENLHPATPLTTLGDSPVIFRWSDGSAQASTTGVTTGGVYNYDNTTVGATSFDAGWRLSVPASDTARRLVFVSGIWQARGVLSIQDSQGGATGYTTTLSAGGTSAVKRYTVTIRAGKGAVVTAKFTEKLHAYGNLSFSAAALATVPPPSEVSFTATAAPTTMNLTAQGPLDWLYLDGPTVNRRRDTGADRIEVANRQAGAAIGTQNDNPVTYSWNDGTPTTTQPGTRNGGIFFVDGTNPDLVGVDLTAPYGYDLTVPAGADGRTLRFTSGAWNASATISVYLDGSATPSFVYTDLVANGTPVTKLFELTLGAGDSARISAQLTRKTHPSGNVTLAGAALAGTSAASYRALAQGLRAEIASADLSSAGAAASEQLNREIATATTTLADESAGRDTLYLAYLFLKAAFDEALSSAVSAAYTYVTNPGLTSSFGWEGDLNAPIAFIDGSYKLRSRGGAMVTFGVPDIPGKIKWYNAGGYLPAFISEYAKGGLQIKVENFADLATVSNNRFEIAYSRMTVTNTNAGGSRLPAVSSILTPLNQAASSGAPTIGAGETVVRDYAVAADRFGATYDWPTAGEIQALGGFDEHYSHMRDYWNTRLAAIADITDLPDSRLINAYKAGYIYTLIIRDDIGAEKQLHVGENGYDQMFDHDTIGIVATLLTVGDYTYARDYLATLPAQLQYDDAKWKYSWPYALYLQKTGDRDFVRSRFDTIKANTHTIESDRIDGGTGIIKQTNAIDSYGYWTIDNWSALTGLTTYRYLAEALGETAEAQWAKAEYDDLLRVANARIEQTMRQYDLDYIPISMVGPNETGPRSDPRDANWASMFLFGRWAWDGYLFGADQSGVMIDDIDQTYTHGFDRRQDISDTIYNFGGYPHGYFSSAYNAGYGSTALRGEQYRDAGIKAYQFMIDKSMSGPFGWWEGVGYPSASSPWDIDHASGGGGSNQHMWGQSTATKVLFDSLIAEKSDGTVIIGRGIPTEWVADGQKVALDNYPVAAGARIGYSMTAAGKNVTIDFTGNTSAVAGYSVELTALKGNIAKVSVDGATIDEAAGTVRLPSGTTRVTITMRQGFTRTTTPPATAVLSSNNGWDTGLADGDYRITMNLWWGSNADRLKLYENGRLIAQKYLNIATPTAQTAYVDVTGRPNGTYEYVGVLVNPYGQTSTKPLTVKVTDAAPGMPVLSEDNWDGDGNYTVTANLWWGTNASSYRLLENGVPVASGALTVATPARQQAMLTLKDKATGRYVYTVEFTNYAGTTTSAPITVKVR